MKKIALLKSRIAHQGGLEKYTYRLAQAFADKGCEVSLLTTGKGPFPSSKIHTHSLAEDSKFSFGQLHYFDYCCKKWLKRNPVDVVFGMDRNRSQTHYRAGNGVHAEYLQKRIQSEGFWKQLSLQYNPLHHSILNFEQLTYESPSLQALFTNSHMVRNEILTHYKTDPKLIHVVHNGVEWHELAPYYKNWQEGRPRLMHERGLYHGYYQFLFAGHGYRRKGLGYLLQALSLLPTKEFQLSVVGNDREQDYYQGLAKKLGIAKQVKFFGPRSDLRSFYQIADALVIPSTYDPFANVTVEALAMGLYIVSSPHNGGSEVLTAQSGTIIENLQDPNSLLQALTRALAHPKNAWHAHAIRMSIQHLDFSFQLDKIVNTTLN